MFYSSPYAPPSLVFFFFFFNDTATTEIYTLSLHDALPISQSASANSFRNSGAGAKRPCGRFRLRSEEHTSELQSLAYLVCRLLLEKKKKNIQSHIDIISRRILA